MCIYLILMMFIITWASYYFNQPKILIGLILPSTLYIVYIMYIHETY